MCVLIGEFWLYRPKKVLDFLEMKLQVVVSMGAGWSSGPVQEPSSSKPPFQPEETISVR